MISLLMIELVLNFNVHLLFVYVYSVNGYVRPPTTTCSTFSTVCTLFLGSFKSL